MSYAIIDRSLSESEPRLRRLLPPMNEHTKLKRAIAYMGHTTPRFLNNMHDHLSRYELGYDLW